MIAIWLYMRSELGGLSSDVRRPSCITCILSCRRPTAGPGDTSSRACITPSNLTLATPFDNTLQLSAGGVAPQMPFDLRQHTSVSWWRCSADASGACTYMQILRTLASRGAACSRSASRSFSRRCRFPPRCLARESHTRPGAELRHRPARIQSCIRVARSTGYSLTMPPARPNSILHPSSAWDARPSRGKCLSMFQLAWNLFIGRVARPRSEKVEKEGLQVIVYRGCSYWCAHHDLGTM